MMITDYSKGDNLRKQAKALRDQADGCRHEALWSDQNSGR